MPKHGRSVCRRYAHIISIVINQLQHDSTAWKLVLLYNTGILFGNLVQRNEKLYIADHISTILEYALNIHRFQGASDNFDTYAIPVTVPMGILTHK